MNAPPQSYRTQSPSPSVHYESSYLKRMSIKPPPSLTSIQNNRPNGTINSSAANVVPSSLQQGIPITRSQSFHHRPKSATPLGSKNRIRPQTPIDMILNNARRRSVTPLGTRRPEDQRSIAPSPISFYRSPSPMSIQSQPIYPNQSMLLYQQPSSGLVQNLFHNNSALPQNAQVQSSNALLGQNGQMLLGQHHKLVPTTLTINQDTPPAPIEALSPNSQDAFIDAGVPGIAVSPSSGHHSAITERRTHLASTHSASMKKSIKGIMRNPTKEKKSRTNSIMSHNLSVSDKIDEEKSADFDAQSESKANATILDPELRGRYWTQLAIRVSSEILKQSSGKNAQKYAEASHLAIITAGESYYDASPETINLVASKASMAVLDAGADPRTAALVTVAILNADKDTPSTEEEIKAKMIELYGSAKDLMKKGYEDSSNALTKISDVASSTFKEIASDNMRKYQDYRLKSEAERSLRLLNDGVEKDPDRRNKSGYTQNLGFFDVVDNLLNGPRHQYRPSPYPRPRRFMGRGPSYPGRRRDYDYSSEDESIDNDRRRRNRRSSVRSVRVGRSSRSLSSSYSDDDSTEFGRRPRARKERRGPTYDEDDFSIDKHEVRRGVPKSRHRSYSDSSVSSSGSVKERKLRSRRKKKSEKKIPGSRSYSSHSSSESESIISLSKKKSKSKCTSSSSDDSDSAASSTTRSKEAHSLTTKTSTRDSGTKLSESFSYRGSRMRSFEA